jgi:hypothetical protein
VTFRLRYVGHHEIRLDSGWTVERDVHDLGTRRRRNAGTHSEKVESVRLSNRRRWPGDVIMQ